MQKFCFWVYWAGNKLSTKARAFSNSLHLPHYCFVSYSCLLLFLLFFFFLHFFKGKKSGLNFSDYILPCFFTLSHSTENIKCGMAHDRHQNWLFLGTKNTDLQAWFHMLSPIGRKEITPNSC